MDFSTLHLKWHTYSLAKFQMMENKPVEKMESHNLEEIEDQSHASHSINRHIEDMCVCSTSKNRPPDQEFDHNALINVVSEIPLSENETNSSFSNLNSEIEEFLMINNSKTVIRSSESSQNAVPDENPNKFACKWCHLKFKLENNYKRHILRKHADKIIFHCKICDKVFNKQDILFQHYRNQHAKSQDDLKCKDCSFTAKRKQSLILHINARHKDKKGESIAKTDHVLFSCSQARCSASFQTKTKLTKHIKVFHKINKGEKQQIECKRCSETFSNQKTLKEHNKNEHRARSSRIHHCGFCTYTCFNPELISSHHLHEHGIANPFPCEFCKAGFSAKHTLYKHVKLMHSYGDEFLCSYCTYSTKNYVDLHLHKRASHGSPNILPCTLCASNFYQYKDLVEHYKSFHMGPNLHANNDFNAMYNNDLSIETVKNVSVVDNHVSKSNMPSLNQSFLNGNDSECETSIDLAHSSDSDCFNGIKCEKLSDDEELESNISGSNCNENCIKHEEMSNTEKHESYRFEPSENSSVSSDSNPDDITIKSEEVSDVEELENDKF